MKTIRIAFIVFASLLSQSVVAKVDPEINSGNPNYPFPQFAAYEFGASHSLGNLGTINAEGVVHAEMEQDIREAYLIHTNEFEYTGESWAGVKYIWTPYKSAYDCTEGDGYGLLAAAYMADKTTFDGYWMCTHDKRRSKTKRYRDCSDNAPNYEYGPYALSDHGEGGNTAADGDVDVALALYVAWMQWGDLMRDKTGKVINDACGNPISYKQEMLEVIRGLVAMSDRFKDPNDPRRNSGMIGFDGYPKGGDTWNEQTAWATATMPGGVKPEFGGGQQQHIDYNAPAYFREFHDLLISLGGQDAWEIEQFRRAEASSDWLIGQLIAKGPKTIPTAGWCTVAADNSTTFSSFNMGEDYRCSWRNIANHTWHGNPTYSWDPTNHKVVTGGNTSQYKAAVRLSSFLHDPIRWTDPTDCMLYGDPKIRYSGPSTLNVQYDPMTGVANSDFFVLNWQNGTGTYSAVSAQDYELMGLLYRQCAIEWDNAGRVTGSDPSDCNLATVPNYMHGWARQMGMMVVSGNYPAPSQMLPSANMKIYRAIKDSITFAYSGDKLTYMLDYRNYGTVDASGVSIVENIPDDFDFVSATKGGIYDPATHTVTWNIGTVPGFKTGKLALTKGQVTYEVRAGKDAAGRYCTSATISCTNGKGWETNEYPNHITPTMQRNCVDIVGRALQINKTVNTDKVNTDNLATYSIDFENSAKAGWLDGGRPRVNVSFANGMDGSRLQLMFRLFNDAIEPYINYGNYRISYYMFDAGLNCYQNASDCPTGWGVSNEIYEPTGMGGNTIVSHENIVEGTDANGKWNQRICVQFAPLLVTTTMHVSRYFGGANCRVHKGGASPFRAVWALYPSDYSTVNYKDDWSWGATYNDDKGGLYYPVTPSWQKLDASGKSIEEPVTKWLTCGCDDAPKTIKNILVEEFDGYVWRRILGTGPMPGRDISNVVIRDTLPKGLSFDAFVGTCPLEDKGAKLTTAKTADGRDIIIWTIPKLQVKQKGTIKYNAVVKFPSGATCETADEDIINSAWIYGDKESQVNDTAKITVTCARLPELVIPTSLKKTTDKATYLAGDDITYTLDYEQTHGSIVDDATAMPADWTLTNYTIANGKLTAASYTTPTSAVFDYAYGKNGYVEYLCTPGTYVTHQARFRIGSGNTIGVVIKSMNVSQMQVTCYVNSTVVLATTNLTFNGGTPYTVRIDLNEDLLRMWINKDTATSPIYSVDKLPVGLGKFGFSNGDMAGGDPGGHTFSKIYTHFDYAYNLVVTDPIPSQVDFVSATNGGTIANGIVRWDGPQGKANPIAPGTKYHYTWTGKVNTCTTFIENVAYVNLMGHTLNSIAGQVISECDEGLCTPPSSVTLTWSDDLSLCAGESVDLTALQVGGDGTSYSYQLLKNGTPTGTPNLTGKFSSISAGKYSVMATDNASSSCNATSTEHTVDLIPAPTYVASGGGSVCTGESLKDLQLDFTGTAPWSISINGGVPIQTSDNPYIISPTKAQTYTFNTFADANCPEAINTTQSVDVVETMAPVASVASTDHEFCGTVSDVIITITAPTTADFAWSDGTISVNANTPNFVNAPEGTYSVAVTDNGCQTILTDIVVSSIGQPTYTITGGGTVCKGELLPDVSIAFTGFGTWTFTLNNGTTTIPLTTESSPYIIKNADAGIYTLNEFADQNCAGTITATEQTEVKVQPLPIISFVGLPTGICENATPITIGISESTGTNAVRWAGGEGFLFPPTGMIPDDYVLTYEHTSATTGCSNQAEHTITVHPKPHASIFPADTTICEGSKEEIEGRAIGGSDTYTSHTWTENNGLYLSGLTGQKQTFSPSAPIGIYPLSYTVIDDNSCADTATVNITVTGKNNSLLFPAMPDVCAHSAVFALDKATPIGGIYSGAGVTGNLTEGYTFDPSDASVSAGGTFTLTYTYAPGSNCEVSVEQDITIKEVVAIQFPEVKQKYCSDDAIEDWSGYKPSTSALIGLGIADSTFNPSSSDIVLDKQFFIYLKTNFNGCASKDSISMIVSSPPTITFTAPAAGYCYDSNPISFDVSPWDANASLTTDPSGMLAGNVFDPSSATVYEQPITFSYAYTDPTTGCSANLDRSTIVHKTMKPTTQDEVCVVGGTVPDLTATGTLLKWYADASLQTVVATDMSNFATGKIAKGEYIYFVTQTENGCESPASEVKLTITNCLTPQVVAPAQTICANETMKTLTATATDPLTANQSYRWYDASKTIVSTTDSYTPTLIGNKTQYDYTVLIYDADNACEGSSTKTKLTVNPLPIVSFTLPTSVCEGAADISLVGSHIGGVFSGDGVANNAGGGYTFSPTIAGLSGDVEVHYIAQDQSTGCENSITKTISIAAAPTLLILTATADVCQGNPIILSASQTDGDEVKWYNEYDDFLQSSTDYTAYQLPEGEYTYSAQAYKNGCVGIKKQITFSILQNPEIVSLQYPKLVCNTQLDTAKISANIQADSWSWTYVEAGIELGDDMNRVPYKNIATTPGTHTVGLQLSNANGCKDSRMLKFTISTIVPPVIVGKDNACVASESLTFQIENIQPDDLYSWYLSNHSGQQSPETGEEYTVIFDRAGVDTVYVQQTSALTGCSATTGKPIYIASHPQAEFSYGKTFDEGVLSFTNITHQAKLEGQGLSRALNYSSWWYFGRTTDNDEILMDTKSPFTQEYPYGLYSVSLRVENEFGCEDIFTVDNINVTISSGLFVPTAFCPTSKSDMISNFMPVGKNLKKYEIWVYDSWGNTVWYSNKLTDGRPAESWDGTAKGGLMPADLYQYRIEASFNDGTIWHGSPVKSIIGSKTNFGVVRLIR